MGTAPERHYPLQTEPKDRTKPISLDYASTFFFFLPIIVSVACPTGPHPPLRLARRPNRGHLGGCIVRVVKNELLSISSTQHCGCYKNRQFGHKDLHSRGKSAENQARVRAFVFTRLCLSKTDAWSIQGPRIDRIIYVKIQLKACH